VAAQRAGVPCCTRVLREGDVSGTGCRAVPRVGTAFFSVHLPAASGQVSPPDRLPKQAPHAGDGWVLGEDAVIRARSLSSESPRRADEGIVVGGDRVPLLVPELVACPIW